MLFYFLRYAKLVIDDHVLLNTTLFENAAENFKMEQIDAPTNSVSKGYVLVSQGGLQCVDSAACVLTARQFSS